MCVLREYRIVVILQLSVLQTLPIIGQPQNIESIPAAGSNHLGEPYAHQPSLQRSGCPASPSPVASVAAVDRETSLRWPTVRTGCSESCCSCSLEDLPLVPEESVDENSSLWCAIHLGLLNDPVVNSACGHCFCRSCIEAWRKQTCSCPCCRTPLTSTVRNFSAAKLLDCLSIHCRYGCKQKVDGTWVVDDTGCPKIITSQDRREHEDVCPFRLVSCPFKSHLCAKIRFKDLDAHYETCPFYVVSFPADAVRLNVGGRLFTTTRQTLTKYPSRLSNMVKYYDQLPKDSDEYVLIDRDGDCFTYILEFLRNDSVVSIPSILKDRIKREAEYYQLPLEKYVLGL